MSRPRLDIGTAGTRSFTAQVRTPEGKWVPCPEDAKPERWRARSRYRDDDGVTRDVAKFASTKGKAETKLEAALRDRQAPARAGEWRDSMLLLDAAELWLNTCVRGSDLAPRSVYQYEGSVANHFPGSTLAGLTLREANRVQPIQRFLQQVADSKGNAASKTARAVLSSILKEAVRLGVLPHSASRDVRPARATEPKQAVRDTTRALTADERQRFLDVLAADERAAHLDVVDLGLFLAGTGCRISEGIAQRWEDIDLEAGTVHIRGTKSNMSDRVIHMPQWLTEALTERSETMGTEGYAFPSPRLVERQHDRPRDRRNVTRELRRVLDRAGLEWATPHSLRRTVATLIDAAGLPVALAADQLGHRDAGFTASHYLGRRGSTAEAAKVL